MASKVSSWSTKEEVLNDIRRAAGRRIGKKEEIESCLIIGDVPPPVLEEDADEQIEMMFGHGIKGIHTEPQAPDLVGIQNMLRMVDANSDDTDNYSRHAAEGSEYFISISKSKVSNLNPNVEEFVPKGRSTSCSNEKNNVVIPGQPTVNDDLPKAGNTQPIEETNKPEPTETMKDMQDIATTLRHRISDAAKSNTFEYKRQKNVAIATLLRLYANNDTTDKQTVKLQTPDFFEKHTCDTKPEETKDLKSEEPTSTTNSSCCNSSTPSMSPHLKLDPEMKKSIDKVNNWLLEPSKRKTPTVCLGPIEFKRKTVPAVKSPVSSVSSKPSQGDSRKFQPSKYAAELAQKYVEKNKIIQTEKEAVTWNNLEAKLREKDLVIKSRIGEKSSESSASTQ